MDKHIFYKRKALTLIQCKSIIDFFENSEQEDKDENSRGYFVLYTDYDSLQIRDVLSKNLKEYVDKHNFLNRLYAGWDVTYRVHLQKYLPGIAYSGEHMEHGKDEWDSTRLLAWMFYLNDIKKDGGTRWPQQNFTSKPRAGDLYIWPAGWTHSHHGIAAPNEIKYIITGWCEFL